jgi:dTDP-glucose 4,6-dehydratase
MAEQFLICGGCGFIGSNFVRHLAEAYPDAGITVLDALTYAGSVTNLGELHSSKRVRLLEGNICDILKMGEFGSTRLDLVVNFAAETHVDRSLYYTEQFVRANVLGVDALLSFCRKTGSPYLQMSTDEVYGPAGEGESFSETAQLNPTSPYAASKAAADLLILSAVKTFGQEAAIVRTTNNYGPRQFPEKLIPFFIHLARLGKLLPIYGDGKQRRLWLYVDDFCRMLLNVISDFPGGEIVNIGATREYTNHELVEMLVGLLGSDAKLNYVTDRPAHDRRYHIDSGKYEKRYGRLLQRDLAEGLKQTVTWYGENQHIFERLRTDVVGDFQDKHYSTRR